jgi:hypothetical protein
VLQLRDGTFIHDIAGVECRGRLEEHDPALLFCYGAMLDSAWNDNEFSLIDPFLTRAGILVAIFHTKSSLHDQEQFIFMVMVMPYEFAVELHELDHMSIEFSRDVRFVVFGNFREFLGEIDFVHERLPSDMLSGP